METEPRTNGTGYRRAQRRGGRLPLSTKIYQGIGALPDTYKNFAFGTFLLFFYNQVLGMPAALASAAIMVALVIDAVTDPVVGSWSDNLITRLGRRHPLMYAAALPLGVCLYLVFSPPAGLDEMGHFFWLLTFAVGVRIAMTFFQVPWSALFAEFSDDYAERSQIVTFRYLCAWIGGVAFTWCTWTFIFPSSPQYTPGHLDPEGYRLFAPIVALLVAAAALLTTQLTRREIPFLLQPVTATRFGPRRAFTDVALAMRNRDFVVLFLAILLASVLGGTAGALEIYLNTYFWGLRPEELRWFVLTIFGSMTAFALVPALQARFDKKRMLVGCLFFLLLNGMAMYSLRFLDVLPDNGDPWLLRILIANEMIRIAAATVAGIMFVSMIADSLDAQELDTGRRQEGVFAAALSFAGKATSGVGILVGGLVLDYVLAFPRGASPAEVDPGLVRSLGLIAGIALPLLYVFPFWLVTRYSLDRARHAEIQRALEARRG
jgi:GPH family glycoside/pentoside/hexuronide:cation symporter